jgi:hypothetical protein
MSWVKPYLRNLRRMQLKDRSTEVDLINAFEGSIVEIEFIARMLPQKREIGKEIWSNKKHWACILMYFRYRTKPQMNYMQEYQRGPLHVGKVDMYFNAYVWTEEDIARYKKMADDEDLELMMSIDGSVQAAMEALGDELEKYLKEAGEIVDFQKAKKKNMKEEMAKAVDPFTSIFKGFGEIVGSFGSKKKDGINLDPVREKQEKENAEKECAAALYQTYKNFKKNNGLWAW